MSAPDRMAHRTGPHRNLGLALVVIATAQLMVLLDISNAW
jgi:hypothetical protein